MRGLFIACARPGLIRAGRRHPAVAAYLIDDFSPADLREMLAEPALAIAIGDGLTEEHIAAYERQLEGVDPPVPAPPDAVKARPAKPARGKKA